MLLSLIIRRMHGGGVIGLRSCMRPASQPTHQQETTPETARRSTYLVSKAAHASPNRLLNDLETARLKVYVSDNRSNIIGYPMGGNAPVCSALIVTAAGSLWGFMLKGAIVGAPQIRVDGLLLAVHGALWSYAIHGE